MRPIRPVSSVLAIAVAVAAPWPALGADASVEARLAARGIPYQVDDDGDYKVTYRYDDEGRTQLVFVSGGTQSVGGFDIREIFAPAARIGTVDGAKALELLKESRRNKLGGWEAAGDVVYFVIKLPDSIDAAALESAMDIAAQIADDMEQSLSGARDEL